MLPSELNIFGIIYKVKYTTDRNDDCWGLIDFSDRLIVIYDNGNIGDTYQTLLHEIIHAIVDILHIEILTSDNKEEVENAIDLLALGLANTLLNSGMTK